MPKIKMSKEEWLSKVEHEGSIYDAIMGWGLTHENLDKDEDPEFYETVKRVVTSFHNMEEEIDALHAELGWN